LTEKYIEAVKNNTLDEFTGKSTFRSSQKGMLKVPVIVRGFPLFAWDHRTITERALRAWTLCLGGSERAADPVFKSMANWTLATRVAKYDVDPKDYLLVGFEDTERSRLKFIEQEPRSSNYSVKEFYDLGWLMTFTSIQPYNLDLGESSKTLSPLVKNMLNEESVVFSNNSSLVTSKVQCLLLGHGLLSGFSKGSRGVPAIVAIDGEDEYIFGGKNVEKMSRGRGRLGIMAECAIVLAPARDSDGKVVFFPQK